MSRLVPPQTMVSTWLQPRVYFLSSLCSTYQHHFTQVFTPSSGNLASRAHAHCCSSYFFGPFLRWALLVSLHVLDSKPVLCFLFICKHSPVIWTSLMVIATASKLVFLLPYLSLYSDSSLVSLLKSCQITSFFRLKSLQRLSSVSERKEMALEDLHRKHL